MKPEYCATTPNVKFLKRTELKPAFSIITLNTLCDGNLRMLSTKYWYACRSPATASPMAGMTLNEYVLYSCSTVAYMHVATNSRRRVK